MSNIVSVLTYSRKLGSPTRKAVMIYFAERASDNGEGIWASKASIAAAIECGRSTVIRIINEFVDEGLLRVVGTRPCANGSTVEYAIDMRALSALPKVSEKGSRSETSPAAGRVPERDGSQSGTGGVPQRDAMGSQSGTQTTIGTTKEPPRSDQPSPDRSVSFAEFWSEWPLAKQGKQKAEAAFRRLSAENRRLAKERCREWAKRWRAAYPGASDIHPTSYLNGKRWEDEFAQANANTRQADVHEVQKLDRWKRIANA